MNLRTCHNEAHDEPHHVPSQSAHELTVKSGLGLCCLCHGEALKPKKKLQLKMANAREWFRMAAGSLKAGHGKGEGGSSLLPRQRNIAEPKSASPHQSHRQSRRWQQITASYEESPARKMAKHEYIFGSKWANRVHQEYTSSSG